MVFVQIIEFRTSKFDEMQQLGNEWEAAAGDDSKARRRVLCRDRNDDSRYFNIVFFDSYDEAMENSNNPVTQEFAGKLMALADGAPTFYDLDVVEDRYMSDRRRARPRSGPDAAAAQRAASSAMTWGTLRLALRCLRSDETGRVALRGAGISRGSSWPVAGLRGTQIGRSGAPGSRSSPMLPDLVERQSGLRLGEEEVAAGNFRQP